MIHKLWHKLFGYKCPNCNGGGMDICGNGMTCGCYFCDGKGRVKEKPKEEDYRYGNKPCNLCLK